MRIERAVLLLAIGLVGACQQEAKLVVRQDRGQVSVTVENGTYDKPRCIRTVDLYLGDPQGKRPLWQLSAFPDQKCVSRIVLGPVPPGFAKGDTEPELRLEKGKSYYVSARGAGWMAGEGFTVE